MAVVSWALNLPCKASRTCSSSSRSFILFAELNFVVEVVLLEEDNYAELAMDGQGFSGKLSPLRGSTVSCFNCFTRFNVSIVFDCRCH